MDISPEGSLPQQQAEASTPAVGLPVTDVAQENKSFWSKLNPSKLLSLLRKKDAEPMAVGSGMAEELAPSAMPLDNGTSDRTDFETASTATADVAPAVDATSVLSDMNKQMDTTAQMGAQINNPLGGLPPALSAEAPAVTPSPDNPPTNTVPEPAPPTPPIEKAAA